MNTLPTSMDDFYSLVNHNPDLISRINDKMVVEYVNDAICKFADRPREFFQGNSIFVLGGQIEGALYYYQRVAEVFETGNPIRYQAEGWYNPTLYFIYEVIPLRNSEGEIKHVLAIIKDITESRQQEEQLRNNIKELEVLSDHLGHQNKLFQDFAYITSHNLRSPLANLAALLKLYDLEENETEKVSIINRIRGISESLSNTVKELDSTISLKGKLRKEVEKIEFNAKLEEVMQSLSADLQEIEADIRTNFGKAETITYPKIYLESIFLNLLTNSVKYRSPYRKLVIEIETFEQEDYILLHWKDNGQGIDLEKHGTKLFGLKNTFHQHKDARGIGLYITRNQIESIGGSISAESELDKGCTFKLRFKKLS